MATKTLKSANNRRKVKMNNAAFQYATGNPVKVIEDTDMISRESAEALFDKYIEQYKKDFEDGKEPEMAVWINMKSEGSYGETSRHWHFEDMIIEDGKLYQKQD